MLKGTVDRPRLRRSLLLRAAQSAVEATNLRELATATLATLQEALHASFGMLCQAEVGGYRFLSAPGCEDSLVMADEYCQIAADDPIHEVKVKANPDVAVLTDMVDRSAIRRTPMDCILERYDAHDLLLMRVGSAPVGREGAIVYLFGRSRRVAGFDGETLEELRSVRPLFQASVERNERAQLANAIAGASPGGVLALRCSGELAWMCREADRLLDGRVPDEIRDAARRVAALADGDVLVRDVPVVVSVPGAHMLEAHIQPVRVTPGAPAMIVVRVMELRRPSWQVDLPPRLRRVLELLETGASEKEIADRAGLSYASTHQYVVQIYRRAGVSSRAQLMATLAAVRH
jgi:DNA-binding CsgD family transcriptional regulator